MTATYDKLSSTLIARTRVHDVADATVATKVAWVEMGQNFLALLTVLAGAVVTFKIFAALDSDGGTPTLVKAHATPTTADAVGDQLALEVSAEEVRAALAHATHVSVEVDMGTNTDTAAVTYIMEGAGKGGRFSYANLTGDVIS